MSIPNLVESYLHLLEHLSVDQKLDIISRLSQSVKEKVKSKHGLAYFRGAWQSKQEAEDIIQDIRASREISRRIDDF